MAGFRDGGRGIIRITNVIIIITNVIVIINVIIIINIIIRQLVIEGEGRARQEIRKIEHQVEIRNES